MTLSMSLNCLIFLYSILVYTMQTTRTIVDFNDIMSIPSVDIAKTAIHSEWVRVRNSKDETFFLWRVWDLVAKFHATTEHLYLLSASDLADRADKYWWTQVIDNEDIEQEVVIEIDEDDDLSDLERIEAILTRNFDNKITNWVMKFLKGKI